MFPWPGSCPSRSLQGTLRPHTLWPEGDLAGWVTRWVPVGPVLALTRPQSARRSPPCPAACPTSLLTSAPEAPNSEGRELPGAVRVTGAGLILSHHTRAQGSNPTTRARAHKGQLLELRQPAGALPPILSQSSLPPGLSVPHRTMTGSASQTRGPCRGCPSLKGVKHCLLFSLSLEGGPVPWGITAVCRGASRPRGRKAEPSAPHPAGQGGPTASLEPLPPATPHGGGLASGRRWHQLGAQVGIDASDRTQPQSFGGRSPEPLCAELCHQTWEEGERAGCSGLCPQLWGLHTGTAKAASCGGQGNREKEGSGFQEGAKEAPKGGWQLASRRKGASLGRTPPGCGADCPVTLPRPPDWRQAGKA